MASATKGAPGMRARTEAVKRLIDMHENQFNEILGEEREKLGLPKDPDAAKREQQIKKHLEALEKLGYNGHS